jgi:oxygen-independent coproporphyrinogen-3 oxidase
MFGLPHQSLEEFKDDLESALELEPDHLSAYGLTLHEGTPFARWDREGRWPNRDADAEAAMFEHLIDRMAAAGFEHYEISNWAKPGRASRHNQKYWSDCDIHAFGASAHGAIGGRRISNERNLRVYVEHLGGAKGPVSVEEDPPTDERSRGGEVMMLALRRLGGVSWEELTAWLGADARQLYASELGELQKGELIEADGDRLRLTHRGVMVADRVMERFF